MGTAQTREAAATSGRTSERDTRTDEVRSERQTNGMSGQRATNERDGETGERRRSDTGHAFGTRVDERGDARCDAARDRLGHTPSLALAAGYPTPGALRNSLRWRGRARERPTHMHTATPGRQRLDS